MFGKKAPENKTEIGGSEIESTNEPKCVAELPTKCSEEIVSLTKPEFSPEQLAMILGLIHITNPLL